MMQNELSAITDFGADVVVFDIDGTLKDLVKEHEEALKITVNGFTKGKRIRKKIVFLLDKLAMWIVKTGLLPTSERMRNILLSIYAFILMKNPNDIKILYSCFYNDKLILFNDTKQLLEEMVKSKEVYFVTINKQSYNLKVQGIGRERIIYTSERKIDAYQRLFDEKHLDKDKVLIVGDNLFDDIKSAKKLGIKSLLVNNYNSKLKQWIARLLNVGM